MGALRRASPLIMGCVVSLIISVQGASAQPRHSPSHRPAGAETTVSATLVASGAAMTVGKTAPAPRAFYPFCEKSPAECQPTGDVAAFSAGPERMAELVAVNDEVNASVTQVTDLEHFGVSDLWTLPTDGKGDCEDIALLKRRKLIDKGWPSGRLLMSAVLDQQGKGHAVLVAVTDQGDVVLDNKRDDVRPWKRTGYFFITRQSQSSPMKWVYTAPQSQILIAMRRAAAPLGSKPSAPLR
ncbi:transglutaminase-like cysteine peptidase [Alsobacter sp. KACC 23698]|uniref:Transglutaminase-like cysteine peptidase n=1 Tax=Alsobacter sp. KACC 23698 TaxID=3149229 RepID=A0AAU7J9G6_9HYPH